jgi:hypothetical protein
MLTGFDASGAYAITSHLGIMLNGSWRNDHTEGSGNRHELLNPEKIQYHRSSADLGIGYFTPINSSQWYFEFFGGIGTGKFSMTDNGIMNSNTPYSRNYNSKLQRIFIQPALGTNGSGQIQFILFTRILFQKYNNIQTDYSEHELEYYAIPPPGGKSYTFVEPGFTFRFYIPSLDIIGFETNWALITTTNGTITPVPIHASIGIHARWPSPHK